MNHGKILFLFILFVSGCSSSINTLQVNKLSEKNTSEIGIHASEPVSISKNLSAQTWRDDDYLYLSLLSESPEIKGALNYSGVTVWLADFQRGRYGIRIPSNNEFSRSRVPQNILGVEHIASLFPDKLRDQLASQISSGEFKARLILPELKMSQTLLAPDFSAEYSEADSSFIIKLPLRSDVYPGEGVLPVNSEGITELEVEIGEKRLASFPRQMDQSRYRSGEDRRGEQPVPLMDYKKITLELVLPNFKQDMRNIQSARRFDFYSYAKLINEWMIKRDTRSSGGMAFPYGGRSRGTFPFNITALVMSETVIKSSFDYMNVLLNLTENEQKEWREKFAAKWKTDRFIPIIANMSTSLHESYLDPSRWTFYLEDSEGNQYELTPGEELENMVKTSKDKSSFNSTEKLLKSYFSYESKSIVFSLPRYNYYRQPILAQSNSKLDLWVVSEKNIYKKMMLEWKVPQNNELRFGR